MRKITVFVPEGIGDNFWVYQRLSPHFDLIDWKVLVGGFRAVNTRSGGWLELLPKTGKVDFIQHNGQDYHELTNKYHPLVDILDKTIAWYSLNYPLDNGTRLEDTDPYPVEWRVPLRTKTWGVPWKKYWVVYVSGSLVGWTLDQWYTMIKEVNPNLPICIIGASYDYQVAATLGKRLKDTGFSVDVFIDLSPERVIYLMQGAEYLLCYQSGIGILADNLGVPQTMLYFPHLERLMYAWCHPEHIRSKYHAHLFTSSPEEIAKSVLSYLA